MKNQKGEALTIALVVLMVGMMIVGHGWGMRHGDHGGHHGHHMKESGQDHHEQRQLHEHQGDAGNAPESGADENK